VIGFVGSVFSPYYAIARRKGAGTAEDHVAFNVVLYGAGFRRWAMTERNGTSLQRDAVHLRIGPSAMEWRNGALHLTIDERCAPIPRRLRGRIVVRPSAALDLSVVIDGQGRHRWTPLAPCARVEVAFDQPDMQWSGHGYLDGNDGDVALEADFKSWAWSRAGLSDGGAVVLYDAVRRDGTRLEWAGRFDAGGGLALIAMPPRHDLARGFWGVARPAHGEAAPRLLRKLEDGPFYTRSLIATVLCGEAVTAVHESLSLERFDKPWVQGLLPFLMPR
jgi:carotenoid 1,2-hydratase